ncbi:MAG: methyltransferase domain-containing protein [Pseudomonadota bacterium]
MTMADAPAGTAAAIKSMKLYSAVERIHLDLKAAGLGDEGPLDPTALSQFDQLHYHGTETVDRAIAELGIVEGACVLDVGAGFGGPARWIAAKSGAQVDAVELQPDLHAAAETLTARSGLAGKVVHHCADILQTELDQGSYDAVVSWLTLYHIPDRAPLFPKLFAALRPGGGLYVEDLYARGEPTAAEAETLREMLFSNTLPSEEAYRAELAEAGFEAVVFEDQTDDWAAFTAARLEAFRAARAEREAVYGAETTDALDAFYSTIASLLAGGRLGGVRLTARRPD